MLQHWVLLSYNKHNGTNNLQYAFHLRENGILDDESLWMIGCKSNAFPMKDTTNIALRFSGLSSYQFN